MSHALFYKPVAHYQRLSNDGLLLIRIAEGQSWYPALLAVQLIYGIFSEIPQGLRSGCKHSMITGYPEVYMIRGYRIHLSGVLAYMHRL